MATFLRRARLTVDLGLAVTALGLAALLVLAWVEYIRTPGTSLVDGYWRGREPWTSLGVWLVLVGSVLTLLLGVLVAFLDGSWIRRLLAAVALLLPAQWWLTALGVLPYPRFDGPDPMTFAYSLPQETAVALLLPALVAAAAALFPRRLTPTSRMAPVHREESGQ